MDTVFIPKGVCSRRMEVEIADGIIKNVSIEGGCNGNLKGISALVCGRSAEEVIGLLRGIKCGFKNTSCPDQLSYALEEALKKEAAE